MRISPPTWSLIRYYYCPPDQSLFFFSHLINCPGFSPLWLHPKMNTIKNKKCFRSVFKLFLMSLKPIIKTHLFQGLASTRTVWSFVEDPCRQSPKSWWIFFFEVTRTVTSRLHAGNIPYRKWVLSYESLNARKRLLFYGSSLSVASTFGSLSLDLFFLVQKSVI